MTSRGLLDAKIHFELAFSTSSRPHLTPPEERSFAYSVGFCLWSRIEVSEASRKEYVELVFSISADVQHFVLSIHFGVNS